MLKWIRGKPKKKSVPPQPCSPVDQLYAQVDKNKKKEKSTTQLEEPSSFIDQQYTQGQDRQEESK